MTATRDETHDKSLRSWVTSANDGHTDFPIQNLPFGVFRRRGQKESPRIGVAIGDRVLDLAACAREGMIAGAGASVGRLMTDDTLNRLMAEGRDQARALRTSVVAILVADNAAAARRVSAITFAQSDVELLRPVDVGDYSDFYASVQHATNVGSLFRPDNPLLPNYKYVPIGYHGRASSLVVSGTPVRRPSGQTRDDANAPPKFGPSQRLDYELELGAYVAKGNALGDAIPIAQAEAHLWGVSLVDDWSARDIQSWEYQPLGPFLAKSFATTVSPWVVTLDALAPFRVAPPARPAGDPEPLPYLIDAADRKSGALDLNLEVWLQTEKMRAAGQSAVRLSRSSFAGMYWTFAQMLAHHTSNGCNLRPGDLIASGTVSGDDKAARGCLLELTRGGKEPLSLPNGETRSFLADGDEVTLRGYAERDGLRIGLGECSGRVISRPG
ncbi:MAG TPA: fumarylacetoacetase [Gemmatimonadaceae bacterium]|nr:fumarylacetoacetase [Gemmatimonadaceae bacterium]